MSKYDQLNTARQMVCDQIARLTPNVVATLKSVVRSINELASASVKIEKASFLNKSEAGDLPAAFRGGIANVIAELEAFRSGFASNGEVVMGDREVAATKSAEAAIAFSETQMTAALAASTPAEALAILHPLKAVLEKAMSYESGDLPMPNVINEDDDGGETVEKPAPAGTSDPASAPSNYATETQGGAAPSTSPNPSTGSILQVAGQNSGPADVLKSMAEKIAKSNAKASDVEWPRDLAGRR